MNKKTKSFAVGIVAVLCFLLVFAIGFGVTGAWYQAQRQASGTVQMNQGIYLKFTNLKTLNTNGDLTDKLGGSLIKGDADEALSNLEIAPGQLVTIKNPTIAATTVDGKASVEFYGRVKVTYTAKYKDADTGLVTGDPVAISADTMEQLFGENLAGQLQPGTNWVKVGDYFYYGSTAGSTTTLAAIPTNDTALFANGNIQFADWTAGRTDVEKGGPTVVTGVDPDGEGPQTAPTSEIGQVIITVEIEVIQKTNVTTTDLTTAGWTGVNAAAAA